MSQALEGTADTSLARLAEVPATPVTVSTPPCSSSPTVSRHISRTAGLFGVRLFSTYYVSDVEYNLT
ncbi:hypothetical protein PISMIDRAFT_12627 [Pisolithus microcarpus 441]|uniref:Uncharacterized protein n=1 Tax=Pisolithus microcarpus 441 TaxID=765257 RepID=A0A0C9ZMJ4_9AGAM|nr:hypothetical protein BKA83DRAFT_12627 [Pisolithus microcarpus]KIK21003.1 hypothetical protein PISMIDRAFT_12627 [Pisolithus microcarpus 441]